MQDNHETKNQFFQLKCSSFVICKNNQGKFLAVKETKKRGWWFPGGKVDPPENFFQAAIREAKEEAGIDIQLKGILRTEYRIKDDFQKIRVIFYAEPKDENQKPKGNKDKHSIEARWLTVEEINALKNEDPGWRGPELYEWSNYVEKGGQIYPLSWLNQEGAPVNAVVDAGQMEVKKDDKAKKRSWCPVQ